MCEWDSLHYWQRYIYLRGLELLHEQPEETDEKGEPTRTVSIHDGSDESAQRIAATGVNYRRIGGS